MSEVETRVQQGTDKQARGPRVVSTPADLAAAREARGMSQIDISQRIKLQVRQVAALEDGNWDLLPGRAFARGALRSYGKLIQVDVTPLLEMIGTTDATSQLPRHALSSGVGPVTDSVYERESRGGTWLWVIGGLVAAGALVYFGSGPGGWFDRDGGAASVTSITAPVAGVGGASPAGGTAGGSAGSGLARSGPAGSGSIGGTSSAGGSAAGAAAPITGEATGAGGHGAPASGSVPAVGAAPGSGTAGGSSAGAAGTGADLPASGVTGAATSAASTAAPAAPGIPAGSAAPAASAAPGGTSPATVSPAAPAATAPAGAAANASAPTPPGSIHFLPSEDSWVRVMDSTGRKVHEALIPAGTPVTVQGKPPYKLRMGNARHLQIRYEGREVKVPAPNEKNITLLELP